MNFLTDEIDFTGDPTRPTPTGRNEILLEPLAFMRPLGFEGDSSYTQTHGSSSRG